MSSNGRWPLNFKNYLSPPSHWHSAVRESKCSQDTTLVRPREISGEYVLFSKAHSTALGSLISNWTTHVGQSVNELNTLFCTPPFETSVEPTNARTPKDNIAKKTMPKSKNKGYHLAHLNLWWSRLMRMDEGVLKGWIGDGENGAIAVRTVFG